MPTKRKPTPATKVMPVFPTWFAIRQYETTPSGEPIAEFNERLKLALYKMRADDSEGIYRSNLAGTWHSKDTVLHDTGAIGKELGAMFHQVTSAVAKQHQDTGVGGEYAWTFIAWCMMYRDRGYSSPHTHPNCHFSSVYYVDAGEDEEAEELTMATGVRIRPGTFECLDNRGINQQAPGLNLQPGFRVNPKSGMMVAFPSWLPHFVHPVRGDHERICISCNATVTKFTPEKETET